MIDEDDNDEDKYEDDDDDVHNDDDDDYDGDDDIDDDGNRFNNATLAAMVIIFATKIIKPSLKLG